MHKANKKVNENLKKGRRTLDAIDEVNIIEDWQYDNKLKKWYIKISITSNVNGDIPNTSIWYVVAEESYPKGTVKIYPDAISGCSLTFPHQSNNGNIEENDLWRTGSLCLDSQLKSLGKYNFESEPSNADWRLWWNVTRAVSWINDANTNNLAVDGHPFELPQFNDTLPYCVFSEDNDTFKEWKKVQNKYGIVELDLNNTYCITREFKTPEGREIYNVEWGKCLSQNFNNPITAMWIMLEEIPVINKWQAPNSLKELIDSVEEHSKGLKIGLMSIINRIIKENSRSLRDGKRHLLLLGFPIPEKIGSENSIIHWQAIKLPVLSHGDKKGFVNGFRDPEDFLWRKDKNHILTPKRDLDWLKSQNWSIQKITNRGQLPKNIISKKTVIIGAGTIGASFAELIVRAGVTKISIIDDDKLEIGNLSRHPLKFGQIEHKKSEKMAFHLNQINPHVQAEFIDKKFNYSKEFVETMNKYDLIIDCTSENTVLCELEKFAFKKDKIFVSISIGLGAELLYLSLQKGKQFKSADFLDKITPWMERDMDKHPEYDLPRDDLKCWNPTFPARYDDILMASSTALKVIEKFIVNNKEESNVVYKKYSVNEIIGYIKVE